MQFWTYPSPRSNIRPSQKGVSLIELVVAMTIVTILSAISIPYIFRYTQKYKSEDQALKVMDLMREAGQLALNKRRSITVQLNVNDTRQAVLRIIDPSGTTKAIPLEPMSEVRMDVAPTGVTRPIPPDYANAAFTSGSWTAVFNSDGTVVTTTGVPISATLYFWPPKNQPFNLADLEARTGEVRAVTIFGGSGAVRYWKHNGTAWSAWQ